MLVLVSLTGFASAELVAMEDFATCTAGSSLTYQGAGSGWDGGWGMTSAGELKVYDDNGNKVARAGGGYGSKQWLYAVRKMSTELTDTFYFSCRIKADSNTALSGRIAFADGMTDSDNAQAGFNWSHYFLNGPGNSGYEGPGDQFFGGDYVTIVGRLSNYTTSTSTIEMWVNPTGVETAAYYFSDTSSGTALTKVDHVLLKSSEAMDSNTISYDDIRIGTEWGDVAVPEPATMSLLGLGGLGVLLRRKR
jgi:hypothetical protein